MCKIFLQWVHWVKCTSGFSIHRCISFGFLSTTTGRNSGFGQPDQRTTDHAIDKHWLEDLCGVQTSKDDLWSWGRERVGSKINNSREKLVWTLLLFFPLPTGHVRSSLPRTFGRTYMRVCSVWTRTRSNKGRQHWCQEERGERSIRRFQMVVGCGKFLFPY